MAGSQDILNKVDTPTGSGGGSSAAKTSDTYAFQAKADDGTYTYYYFEATGSGWYIRRKNKTTLVHDFTKGTGGYTSVYVDATHGPSGSPTFARYGSTF